MASSLEKIEKVLSEEELARIEHGADGVVGLWRKLGWNTEALEEMDALAEETVRLHRAKVRAEKEFREATKQRKSGVLSWRNSMRNFRRDGVAELMEDLQSTLEEEWLRHARLEPTRRNRLIANWCVGLWLTTWFIRVKADVTERYKMLHMFRVIMRDCLKVDVTERFPCGAAAAEIDRFRSNLVEMGYDLSGSCLEHPVSVGDVAKGSGEGVEKKDPAGAPEVVEDGVAADAAVLNVLVAGSHPGGGEEAVKLAFENMVPFGEADETRVAKVQPKAFPGEPARWRGGADAPVDLLEGEVIWIDDALVRWMVKRLREDDGSGDVLLWKLNYVRVLAGQRVLLAGGRPRGEFAKTVKMMLDLFEEKRMSDNSMDDGGVLDRCCMSWMRLWQRRLAEFAGKKG